MDRITVVANPVASQFTGGAHRDVMATLSKHHEVEAIWPSSAAEAAAAAASAVQDGSRTVVAMGGDGMAHHVAQGLVGTDASLGIIPVGTTNVIARLLGVPARPVRAARFIAQSTGSRPLGAVRMDLVRGTTETTHHSLFACGVGIDAEVVEAADRDPYRKYRFGSIHYARTALGVALGGFPRKKPHVSLASDQRVARVTSVLVQFREAYTYFGRIPIRITRRDPDPMTVLLIERLRRRRVPRIGVLALLRRDLDAVGGLAIWEEVDELTVHADPPVAAQADGEPLGIIDSGRISWSPGALRVVD